MMTALDPISRKWSSSPAPIAAESVAMGGSERPWLCCWRRTDGPATGGGPDL